MKTPDLYIIHGWTYTTKPWDQTLAALKKSGLQVEMLNVPGLTTNSKKVWTIEDYVNWANRHIPDGAVALGHSNGGRILLNLCAKQPEKLGHLILLDSAGVYEPSKKRDASRRLSKAFGFLKKIPLLAKIWHKLTGASDYARAPENMKKTLTNMLDSDKNLDLSRVTTSTSIIWGADDTITPPRQAEILHEKLPNSTLKIYPHWTHAPYISHPDALAEAILRAFRKPPKVKPAPKVTDAASASAALVIKKAPEPILKNPTTNPVAPDVATKLVLHRGDSKLTDGLVISDAEGAAVKYEPRRSEIATKTTDASVVSATLAIKENRRIQKLRKKLAHSAQTGDSASRLGGLRAKKTPQPPTSPAQVKQLSSQPASAAFRSSAKSVSAVSRSAVKSTPESKSKPAEPTSELSDLSRATSGAVDFVPLDADQIPELSARPGLITSASVPKTSKFRRKGTKKSKAAPHRQLSATTSDQQPSAPKPSATQSSVSSRSERRSSRP